MFHFTKNSNPRKPIRIAAMLMFFPLPELKFPVKVYQTEKKVKISDKNF